MPTDWIEILEAAKYPTEVLVIDFETYFSKTYSLKKLSTIEYIMHDTQYEELGVACLHMSSVYPHLTPQADFWHDTNAHLKWLRHKWGQQLERVTVVAHNARFDGGILAYRYNIRPPYFIDTLGLARHIAARKRNRLKDLCERYDLTAKGDTAQFQGLHWYDLDEPMHVALAEYANNDAERTWELFTILLPQLTRPNVELRLMQETLQWFTRPLLQINFEKAGQLLAAMETEKNKALEKVSWVLDCSTK